MKTKSKRPVFKRVADHLWRLREFSIKAGKEFAHDPEVVALLKQVEDLRGRAWNRAHDLELAEAAKRDGDAKPLWTINVRRGATYFVQYTRTKHRIFSQYFWKRAADNVYLPSDEPHATVADECPWAHYKRTMQEALNPTTV